MTKLVTTLTRRALLGNSAKLSVAGLAALSGMGTLALTGKVLAAPSADVDLLNVALGLEHEAIAAYQLGAESKLLQPAALNVAVLFQSHHKGHRDALISTITKIGGTPVQAKTNAEYATSLNAASLKSQNDVLQLATKLELGAVNAYLGVIPSFADRDLAKVAGRLASDEAMHWTALISTLGQPLPSAPLTFGA